MRAEDIQRHWYDGTPPPLLLRLAAALYRGAAAMDRAWHRRRPRRPLPVPVVVVGNISVGGTGKTPLTIAIVQQLRQRGWQPGVVSRGHGGRVTEPTLLDAHADPSATGDEPALIREHGIPVAVGRDRTAAARLLLSSDLGVDVVVADDGLQHHALARDIEICVIDGVRRFGNGWLLPAGPLRESPARLATVDFRVVNGGQADSGEIPMALAGDSAVNLLASDRCVALEEFAGQRVHAVAGIGNPQRFFDALRGRGIEVIEHPFPDHHAYLAGDFAFDDGIPVLMTDKDAVKCMAFAQPNWWRVPVTAELPASFFDQLDRQLRSAKKNHEASVSPTWSR